MSQRFKFLNEEDFEKHLCEVKKEGDWLIFTCPECDYERRIHRFSGKMKVRQGAPNALHRGQYRPVGLDFSSLIAN